MPYGYYPELKANYNDKKELMPCYYWTLRWSYLTDEDYEILKNIRKQAVKDEELFRNLLAEFKEDRKFFKEEMKHQQRIQKACTLIECYFNIERKYIPSTDWPEGLASELDLVTDRLWLNYYKKEKK